MYLATHELIGDGTGGGSLDATMQLSTAQTTRNLPQMAEAAKTHLDTTHMPILSNT